MKNLKLALTSLALLMCVTVSHAGNPFVPNEQGMKLQYETKDGKGKTLSYSVQTVASIEETDGQTHIRIVTESMNVDGEPLTMDDIPLPVGETVSGTANMAEMTEEQLDMSETADIRISGDKVVMPLDAIREVTEEIQKGIPQTEESLAFSIDMNEMSYPVHPSPNQSLDEVSVRMSLSMEGMTMEIMTITIKDRLIIGKEPVTVPAGTFDCWKVSERMVMKTPQGTAFNITFVTWYAEGIGEVKSQTLNKRGNIEETSELVSVKR